MTTPSPPPAYPHGLPRQAFTPWSRRVVAFLIDWTVLGLSVAAPYLVLAIWDADCARTLFDRGASCPTEVPTAVGVLALAAVALIPVYFLWNFCYLQGKSGKSIGKAMMKFRVVSALYGRPIGFWRSFARQLAHCVDVVCYVGFLWPLWDKRRQTFADKIADTVCLPDETPADRPDMAPQLY